MSWLAIGLQVHGNESEIVMEQPRKYSLKAAGIPMMMPSPLASSLLKSTSFPGDFSKRGTDGMESPTLTILMV